MSLFSCHGYFHVMLLQILMIAQYKLSRGPWFPFENKFDGASDPFPLEGQQRWSRFALSALQPMFRRSV